MELLISLWDTYLYHPVFNGLIWIYNNWTDQNLGWAIVYLTLLLRAALLPFTIVNEMARVKNKELEKDVDRISHDLANDPILKNEEIRRILRKRRVKPWAKVVVLGIQLLMLVLLYEVFLRGITGEKILSVLYPAIEFPGKINTVFYGFELGQYYSIFWPSIVTVYLAVEIYLGFKSRKDNLTKADLSYFILFPAAIFIVLYYLPMVKALFVFTSLVFSTFVHFLINIFFRGKKNEEPSTNPTTA